WSRRNPSFRKRSKEPVVWSPHHRAPGGADAWAKGLAIFSANCKRGNYGDLFRNSKSSRKGNRAIVARKSFGVARPITIRQPVVLLNCEKNATAFVPSLHYLNIQEGARHCRHDRIRVIECAAGK